MKRTIFISLLFTLIAFSTEAQNDTMYIMKNGVVVGKYNVNTDVDSLIYYLPTSGVFTDSRDGNTYNWVKIGAQVWMAENLKYLPSVVGPNTASYSVPYYYVYGYNGTNVTDAKATYNYNTYGVLYNWRATMAGSPSSSTNPSGVQGVCPTGWHLPSVDEWIILENFLADNGFNYDGSVGGGHLKTAKSVSTSNQWTFSINIGAVGNTDYSEYRNKSGFSALPGGIRDNGFFSSIMDSGLWWSSTEVNSIIAYHQNIAYLSATIYRTGSSKIFGFSVRCVKN